MKFFLQSRNVVLYTLFTVMSLISLVIAAVYNIIFGAGDRQQCLSPQLDIPFVSISKHGYSMNSADPVCSKKKDLEPPPPPLQARSMLIIFSVS